LQLTLKAGSSVTCAFDGLDIEILEAFGRILRRQNYSKAKY